MHFFLRLLSSVIICFLASAIGSLFTVTSLGSWYEQLAKPVFQPPNWLFAPVWTVLYLMMAISLAIVWNKGFKKSSSALFFFIAQLMLNTFWSILFFGLQNPLFAFINIIFLIIFITLTIKQFSKISKLASWLLVPYLAWCLFASVLNGAILFLN